MLKTEAAGFRCAAVPGQAAKPTEAQPNMARTANTVYPHPAYTHKFPSLSSAVFQPGEADLNQCRKSMRASLDLQGRYMKCQTVDGDLL